MRFLDIGVLVVDIEKLVYVERGRRRDDRNDWEAVLVMEGGLKCEPKICILEVKAIITDTHLLSTS